MRVAIVHDWLTGMRGGEKALEAVCERFPDAEIYTLVYVPEQISATIRRHPVHTSWLQRLPGIRHYYRLCLPLFPAAIERFRFDGYALVVSLSHCVAKSVRTPQEVPHVCYCFTPMRYAWDQFEAYFGPARLGRLGSACARVVMRRLAAWDARTATRPRHYIAISRYVAERIRRYYRREASVVYPPVDTTFFTPDETPRTGGALIVSALVPYKRIDLAIDACRRAHVPLTIVGDGPERASLERRADDTVRFVGRASNEEIRALYRSAGVVLLPGEEDFGIVPLEAQACGCPVVALARGGALETVVAEVTGILVDDSTAEAFAQAIRRALTMTVDAHTIRTHAERFSRQRFGDEIAAEIARVTGVGAA